MKERPINFNGNMVRAILDGRKTQTRRIVKPQPLYSYGIVEFRPKNPCQPVILMDSKFKTSEFMKKYCPYGQPGDRLWVRETWHVADASYHTPSNGPERCDYTIGYRAKGNAAIYPNCIWVQFERPIKNIWQNKFDNWRPSIHMPKWASRITLEVTGVRVERIQDISNEDARAEGAIPFEYAEKCIDLGHPYEARSLFKTSWDKIYPGSWEKNCWVWVVEFRRVN